MAEKVLHNWYMSMVLLHCIPLLMAFLLVVCVLQGVGINAQGVVNAVLFCFFTRPVRMRLWRSCKQVYHRLCCCILEKEREEEQPPTEWDALKELTTSSYESLN